MSPPTTPSATPMRPLLTLLCAILVSGQIQAEEPDIARLFSAAGIKGTMVIATLDGSKTYVHNEPRAQRRFPAASTFKIFNTLIALDEGVITAQDEVIHWDGRVHDWPDWNQDHTLKSAYAASCVWCYQELARRIGGERYRVHLARADYGQLQEPAEETTFWLDGALTISAREQVNFLRQVILRTLPYATSAYEGLGAVMLVEPGEGYSLRAKTGWAARSMPQIGWYVGYLEQPGVTWIFAMNMDIDGKGGLPQRQALTRASLKVMGILD